MAMVSETMIPLCPKPNRIPPSTAKHHMASLSRAPECDETVACQELRDMMRRERGEGQLSPECGRQFVTPPLSRASMASTCVGLSPRSSLCLSPALGNVVDRSCSLTPESGGNGTVSKQIEVCGKGQRQKAPQVRKIFVGGIPRDMDQKCLQEEFGKFGGVNKAWLQRARESGKQDPHRGFGFVIFHEADTVDQLLGAGFSRFLMLSNGVRVEVKRAIGSREMGQAATGPDTVPENMQGSDMTPARATMSSSPQPVSQAKFVPGEISRLHASSPAPSSWSDRASLASPAPPSPTRFSQTPMDYAPIAAPSPMRFSQAPSMEFAPIASRSPAPQMQQQAPSWPMTDARMFSRASPGSQQEPCTFAAWTSPEMLIRHASSMYGGRLELALMEAMPDVYDD